MRFLILGPQIRQRLCGDVGGNSLLPSGKTRDPSTDTGEA